MRILITGSAGYIGSHFLKLIKKHYPNADVLNIDIARNESIKNIVFGKLKQVDLRDKSAVESVISSFKPEIIVHFAAYISVPESVKNPLKYYENNFVASLNLINSALNNNVKKFIFSSTAAVYGVPDRTVVDETTPLKPINPYGNSKKMVEELLKDVKRAHPDFNYMILRYFNVAGNDPDMEVGIRQNKFENLIPIVLNRIKNNNFEIDIYGHDWNTPDGTCIRDYIHVLDIAQAHLAVMKLLEKNKSNTFNVGYGRGYSVLEVINEIERVCNIKLKKNFVNRRPGDPESLIADNSKIIKLTDWNPKYNNLNTIISSAWNWIKNN